MKKFVLAVLFVLGCAVSVQAAPFPATDEKLPVDVVADRMVYETDKNTVTFQGSVEAVRGEFTMWSERLTLYMKASKDGKKAAPETGTAMTGSELERIVAQGNVRFKNGTQTGSSEKATYLADQGLLVLEGDPVLHDGENSIRGKVIRYYTKENRSVVEGGPKQRVHAVFSSGDKEKRP